MKFCYFDESGMGEEPYLVIVGIIVDATRMHITKDPLLIFQEMEHLICYANREFQFKQP
jgi:hypothetical protein